MNCAVEPLSNLTSGIKFNGPGLIFAVKVNAVIDSPAGGPVVTKPPFLVLKYSPLKPKVTSFDTANCGYNATPSKPPFTASGAEKLAPFSPNLKASVIW